MSANAADGYLGDYLPHKANCRCEDCSLERAQERIAALEKLVSKAEQENVALRAKFQQISDWCEAYPLDVFTEPDMVEVRRLLGDTLLTQLSAHNFRHVLDGIKQIAARGREGESEVQP